VLEQHGRDRSVCGFEAVSTFGLAKRPGWLPDLPPSDYLRTMVSRPGNGNAIFTCVTLPAFWGDLPRAPGERSGTVCGAHPDVGGALISTRTVACVGGRRFA
jgi:hypothetical protein